MPAQHHYVSKFHLKQFTDPDSQASPSPWVWHGRVPDGPIKRRAPKNLATLRGMFDGPGGLADRHATIESFLANEVEGPAARAMADVLRWPIGCGGQLPPTLSRYLAWAAARSLPMQTLGNLWGETANGGNDEVVEEPPDGLLDTKNGDVARDVQMMHPTHGTRLFPASSDFNRASEQGWFPDMRERTNFLEGVQVQAYYFQVRWFPRLKWSVLHAPEDSFFIIGDRPVGWCAEGFVDAPPSCLRDPSSYVLAPLSRGLVLVGKHTTDAWHVTPEQINAVIACFAHEWIVGPTPLTVKTALAARFASRPHS